MVALRIKRLSLTFSNASLFIANPERNLISRITMLELLSFPVYLKSRRGRMEQKDISLGAICEPDYYPVFISRVIVTLAAVLAQLADSVTSTVKVLTSAGAGML